MPEKSTYRIVHYLNQFFAGLGGEDKAGVAPFELVGAVGPGRLLEQSSGGRVQIVATVVCGDNFFVENSGALDDLLGMVRSHEPDGLVAGPAFAAGRYGEACGAICRAIKTELDVPAVTGLAPLSPAVDMYRKDVRILRTGGSAADMKNSLPRMGEQLVRLLDGREAMAADLELFYPRGLKKNVVRETTAAERAIEMVLAKYRGEPWRSEVTIPLFEVVPPAPPAVGDRLRVALVTDGGLILRGNPEGMASGRSTRWCAIDVTGWDALFPEDVEVNHFGYDTRSVTADPNRLVPLDVMRALEREGSVELHSIVYSTAGAATSMEAAAKFGQEIAAELRKVQIQAAILTST